MPAVTGSAAAATHVRPFHDAAVAVTATSGAERARGRLAEPGGAGSTPHADQTLAVAGLAYRGCLTARATMLTPDEGSSLSAGFASHRNGSRSGAAACPSLLDALQRGAAALKGQAR